MSTHHAILLINLGSPDAPTEAAIARYLLEFLSDRRVVDLPKLLWQPILRGIILRTRPKKLVPAYEKIWRKDLPLELGAPLKAITHSQAQALQIWCDQNLTERKLRVYWAMRYQNPSIASVLAQMADDGISEITLLPLYPQFSNTTTETALVAVANALYTLRKKKKMRNDTPLFHIQTLHDYHDHPHYIQALAQSVRAYWLTHGTPNFAAGDKVLMSFHGLPQRNIQRGDPYQTQCERTHQLLADELGLSTEVLHIAFQSRFGRQEWIRPYSSDVLQTWAKQGVRRVDVLCAGFAADCLETLEEVAHELRAEFIDHGGQDYHYIPCLNDSPAHIACLGRLIEQTLNTP